MQHYGAYGTYGHCCFSSDAAKGQSSAAAFGLTVMYAALVLLLLQCYPRLL